MHGAICVGGCETRGWDGAAGVRGLKWLDKSVQQNTACSSSRLCLGSHPRQLVPHDARTCPHDLCAREQLNLHPVCRSTLRDDLVWRHQRACRPAIVAAEQQLCRNRGSEGQPVLGVTSPEMQGTLPASIIRTPRLPSAPVLLAMGPSTVMRLMPARCSGSSGAAPATAAPWALLQPSRPLAAAQLAGGTGEPFFSSTKLCNQWSRQHGTTHQHWLRQQAHRAPLSPAATHLSSGISLHGICVPTRTLAAASWAKARCSGLPTTLAGMRRYGLRGLLWSSKCPNANLTSQEEAACQQIFWAYGACIARGRLGANPFPIISYFQAAALHQLEPAEPTWPSAGGAERRQPPPRSPGLAPQPPCRNDRQWRR